MAGNRWPKLEPRGVLAALILAMAWPYILIDVLGFWLLEAEIHSIQALGISGLAEIHLVRVIIDPLICSLILGLLCGIPFGLVVRQNIFRYWLIFVVTLLIVGLVQSLLSEWGIALFLDGLSVPDHWLYLAGVLVVAMVVARIRTRFAEAVTSKE
jgi:hypothetical protein